MTNIIEDRLNELGFKLPNPPQPISSASPTMRTGNLIFVSGQGPEIDGKWLYQGKIGEKYTKEEGYKAAQITILNSLAHLKREIGSLDKVSQIVKLVGWVNSAPDFFEHPFVINGASDLLLKLFGEKGKHARSGVGSRILCFDIPVEIEMIVEVES
jgi:enamine deaminase RidA (YjgF/YER057c/UK114 family)